METLTLIVFKIWMESRSIKEFNNLLRGLNKIVLNKIFKVNKQKQAIKIPNNRFKFLNLSQLKLKLLLQ